MKIDESLWRRIQSMVPRRRLSLARLPHLIGKIDDAEVWLVDGNLIKTSRDMDFLEGANDMARSFVPFGQIWVDGRLSPAEVAPVIDHEVVERRRMKRDLAHGVRHPRAYGRAHEAANLEERVIRRRSRALRANSIDEDLREAERAYLESGGNMAIDKVAVILERSGATPKAIGRSLSALIAKRGKKPGCWIRLLDLMGADHGRLGLRSVADAKRVSRLMLGKDWDTIAGVSMPENFYEPDHEHNVEAVMDEIDSLLETHGVETLSSDMVRGPGGYWTNSLALYVNTGDGYDTTVIYDTAKGEFFLGAPNDLLEELEAGESQEDD